MYSLDQRVVMTLDAGGTNFVFSAIRANKEIVTPISYPSNAHDLELSLKTIEQGFSDVKKILIESGAKEPVAISFAFPGPADYPSGIIGDLPNFPSYRGGVALGYFLKDRFEIPVFINNDGDLFAYGESVAGALPYINNRLKELGSSREYHNLIGVTLGTGFGAGLVVDNKLHLGDNSDGGNIWNLRNKKYNNLIVEESVSIRAVSRVYAELSGDNSRKLTPYQIYTIAEGELPGDREAAVASFRELGEMAADALSSSLALVDGIIVVGGGLSGASKYILPAMIEEFNSELSTLGGATFRRSFIEMYNLESDFENFALGGTKLIQVPMSSRKVNYNEAKKSGVCLSKLGTSHSVAIGAYSYALAKLDEEGL